jgi:hypothetical protein
MTHPSSGLSVAGAALAQKPAPKLNLVTVEGKTAAPADPRCAPPQAPAHPPVA